MKLLIVCLTIGFVSADMYAPGPVIASQPQQSQSWSEWERWSQCSVTCGNGETIRRRRCVNGGEKPNQMDISTLLLLTTLGDSSSGINDILPLLLLQGNQGGTGSPIDPMILLLLTMGDGGSSDISKLLPFLLSGQGNIDPLLLLLMTSNSTTEDLLPLLLSGSGNIDPMLLLLLTSNSSGSSDISSLLPLLLSGGGDLDITTLLLLTGLGDSSSNSSMTDLILMMNLFGESSKGGCHGDFVETKPCSKYACPAPQNCLGPWGEWSSCSATCGYGKQNRLRTCNCRNAIGVPACNDKLFESKNCGYTTCTPMTSNTNEWSAWSDWTTCHKASDGQCVEDRTRKCYRADNSCDGPFRQYRQCNSYACTQGTYDPYKSASKTTEEKSE